MREQTQVNLMSIKLPKKKKLWNEMWKHRVFYFFILPGIIWFILFQYLPLYGLTLAFKEFNFAKGILGSPWVGLKYFNEFFSYYQFKEVVRNTIVISLLKLIIAFPMPIILALMLNETRKMVFKRTIQTISYLPYFISWVVVVTLIQRFLTPDGGPINNIIESFGQQSILFIGDPDYFYIIVIVSYIFKTAGWGTIIYLASMAGIDPQLYEAANIDGAGRFRQIFHITLPCIMGVMMILFILEVGNLAFAGYEQIYLLNNPGTTAIGTILDTHTIQVGLKEGRFSYAVAVTFFQSIIGFCLVVITNSLSKRVSGTSLW